MFVLENTIEQINTDKGRFYLTPQGKKYPSATTVVGLLNQKYIAQWVQKVGVEQAEKIKKKAGEHGTRWHDLMENTLLNGIQKIPIVHEFAMVYPLVVRNILPKISNIRAVELRMWSDSLELAGTVDLIADWKGVPAIIDWKTTSHLKTEKDIIGYWCQTASYSIMAKERFGFQAEKLVLVFNENDSVVYVHEQPLEPWCRTMIALRKKFKELKGY